MKATTLSKLLVLMILVVQLSCKNEQDTQVPTAQAPPVSLGDQSACHRAANRDSTAIHAALQGNWKWEYIRCYWTPEQANYKDYEGMTIRFNTDNTLEVKVNGQITQNASWEIIPLNDGNFRLELKPLVVQLVGRILFCTERVVFNDSYTDGCDNYFKKEN